jgi:VIT1/CCC1 family predicted Fe2+/Mn2+ transporter
MPRIPRSEATHLSYRSNWLRAAVLGANDGILSTASVVIGVAASGAGHGAIVTAGVAALSAGTLSMAAGEYVSVSSQRDTENADLRLEQRELGSDPERELQELTSIYEARGLPPELAGEVAVALTEHDALATHARDELGLAEDRRARPLQAAAASAAAFASGGVLPLLAAILARASGRILVVVVVTVLALMLLGDTGARLGGAGRLRATGRVVLWGLVAMGVTAAIGAAAGSVTG